MRILYPRKRPLPGPPPPNPLQEQRLHEFMTIYPFYEPPLIIYVDPPANLRKLNKYFRKKLNKCGQSMQQCCKSAKMAFKAKWKRIWGVPPYLDERVLRKTHLKGVEQSPHNVYYVQRINKAVKASLSRQKIKLASSYGLTAISTRSTIVVTKKKGEWLEVKGDGSMYRVLYRDFEEGLEALTSLVKEEWKVEIDPEWAEKEKKKNANISASIEDTLEEKSGGVNKSGSEGEGEGEGEGEVEDKAHVESKNESKNEGEGEADLESEDKSKGKSKDKDENEDGGKLSEGEGEVEDVGGIVKGLMTDSEGWIMLCKLKLPDPDLASLYADEREQKEVAWSEWNRRQKGTQPTLEPQYAFLRGIFLWLFNPV